MHTQNRQMDKLGSCPYESCTCVPLVKQGPLGATSWTMASTEQLLKPGQVLARELTVVPVLMVWGPQVPPGPLLVRML